MIPSAPLLTYDRPPELGGPVANFPMVDNTVRNGMFRELWFNWFSPSGAGPSSTIDNVGDARDYDNGWEFTGNAWTVQLSIRPGLYVEPEILAYLGYADPVGTTAPYG